MTYLDGFKFALGFWTGTIVWLLALTVVVLIAAAILGALVGWFGPHDDF